MAITYSRKSGFTLMEILISVVIISILVTIVGVSVIRRPGEAKVAAAKLQVKNIKHAVQMYRMDQGRVPTETQGLEALCVKPVRGPIPEKYPEEGYLDSRKVPIDPWGNAYIYLAPGRNKEPFEIISYGSDGEPGGEDEASDISSSDL